jgi:hypothetical protein
MMFNIACVRAGGRVETEATLVERKSTPVDAGPAQENDDEKNPHGKKD